MVVHVRRTWIDRALAVLLVGLTALASACSEKPTEATFDNVLDPDVGPDLMLPEATFAGRQVTVEWNLLLERDLGEPVAAYTVYRSPRPDRGFTDVETIDEGFDTTIPGVWSVTDKEYIPDTVNYYAIAFQLQSGRETTALGSPMATVTVPPRVALQSGTGKANTRTPLVLLQSARSAEGHISSDGSFGDFTTVPLAPPNPGSTFNQGSLHWDLGPASGNGDSIYVYMRAPRAEGGFSVTDTLAVEVAFSPALTVVETAVFQPDVHLRVPIAGIVQMRFAATEAELGNATWLVPDTGETPNVIPLTLSTADDSPEVWAEYESDFGFFLTTTLPVTPTPVTTATLSIDGGAETTTAPDRIVEVVSSVPNATLMRLSESPDFAGVPWVAYEDTVSVQLSPTPGVKKLYGWYTNVYDPVGTATSDEIILVGETLR